MAHIKVFASRGDWHKNQFDGKFSEVLVNADCVSTVFPTVLYDRTLGKSREVLEVDTSNRTFYVDMTLADFDALLLSK